MWFASVADRAAFAEEPAAAVAALIVEYHDGSAERGRDHRVVVAVHPSTRPCVATTGYVPGHDEALARNALSPGLLRRDGGI